jgi:hypothetical protein
MNKFELINRVLMSTLAAGNKALLIELIMRADDQGYSWPSVQRLCMARGIKHEKNFKGADWYLAGLVTKTKKGRKMTYTLNIKGIEALEPAQVEVKHTPPLNQVSKHPAPEGEYDPALAENTPASADNAPELEGANSTKNITKNTTEDNTITSVADAPDVESSLTLEDAEPLFGPTSSLNSESDAPSPTSSSEGSESADAGVSSNSDFDSENPGSTKFDDFMSRLKPETRAMCMRGSEVPSPLYASEEEQMAARMR